MSVYSGDFLGFQLGDVHSSQLNITRVSSGDRYSETFIPNFSDSTAQVPGGDGVYYWDTFYTQKPFTIDFAFDDLHDEDIRRLRQVFGFKGVQQLIFDEAVYKKYYVRCSAPPTLKYISFKDHETKIYKGEGSINLVAYYPYGVSTMDIKINGGTNLLVSNIGDIETPIKIYYNIDDIINQNLEIKLIKKNNVINKLNITIEENLNIGANGDKYICIDNKTHLIEGLDENYKKTGYLYNRYITSGDFFLLPLEQNTITTTIACDKIEYNYLYY